MKKSFFIAALIITAALVSSCDRDDDDDDKLVISGTLTTDGMMTRSSVATGAAQIFSGVVQNDNTIEGMLQDGDMIFRLRGLYDPDSKIFSMQAASSVIVFSLTGQLTAANAIDPAKSQASVQIRANDGEWSTISLNIAPGDQTVSGTINQTGGAEIPAWCRGTWHDQLINVTLIVTENAITIVDYDGTIQPITIVELTNINAGAIEVIARTVLLGDTPMPYTARFYVANSWNSTLSAAIGNVRLNDLYDFIGGELGAITLSQAVGTMGAGDKMFITPFCAPAANANVIDVPDITTNGFSPMFETTAAAKLATNQLRAIPTFSLVLMRNSPFGSGQGPTPPTQEPGP